MACPGSFLSCCKENDTDPKSGRYLDPDKPVCATTSQGDITDQTFLHTFFVVFVPNSLIFVTDHRVAGSVIGSVPVENT